MADVRARMGVGVAVCTDGTNGALVGVGVTPSTVMFGVLPIKVDVVTIAAPDIADGVLAHFDN